MANVMQPDHSVYMTTARTALIAPGTAGSYHCVQRCVRRAFLCGEDRYSGRSFEHRKAWVEARLRQLADCFSVAIHAYAVMSNHLHVVVQFDPTWQKDWTAEDVADRWVRLFPPSEDTEASRTYKRQLLLRQPERLAVLRDRLGNLSWFMKCLAEPIARAANAEDHCKGRFWEGRFKAQVLCNERAVLAAMAYVDLNPIRAGAVHDLEGSTHTSLHERLTRLKPAELNQPLDTIAGKHAPLGLSLRAYVELVEWTGQQVRPGKRGALVRNTPGVLKRYEKNPDRWALRVKAVGSGYWRVIGSVADLIETATRLQQCWVKGLGLARALEETA